MKFKLNLLLSFIVLATYSCKKTPTVSEPEEEIIIEQAQLDESVSAVIPHIYIETAENAEIVSKDDYINGTVHIKGNAVNADLVASTMRIKGRGNSTWNKPKKPYRIKLDAAASVLGLKSAKDWVLLANWQDYTFMTNAVAMKIGQQLGMPYTNTIIPVDVTINGKYAGNYTLTQQIEVKDGRVNIGKDGVLLELDTNYDEDWQFISTGYSLPVMVKSPDIETQEQFNTIKQEFLDFEALLKRSDFPNNNYGNYFDKQQLVNYLIVYNLTANLEIKHPKSVYMHKAKGGKYTLGPVWDFDWGFGLDDGNRKYFTYSTDNPLLKSGDTNKGVVFFSRFLNDPEVKNLYKSTWTNYKNNNFDELLKYIEQYAASIRVSQTKDLERWKADRWHYDTEWAPFASNFPEIKKDLKTYLRKRANYITSYVNKL
ncbi:CotH kinase family protein [Pedobacter sp. UBA4863]|uniref:CotH kinase family protein n=1 Tax=Pedobacter sp. UBA4863 TaxID=1947060 RepID=UPI0025F36669|nr:CotH kinase family protein [Pedobacter sp. UBA4863]